MPYLKRDNFECIGLFSDLILMSAEKKIILNLTLNLSFDARSKWDDLHIKKTLLLFLRIWHTQLFALRTLNQHQRLNPGSTRYSFIDWQTEFWKQFLNIEHFYKMSVSKACTTTKCFSLIRTNIEIFCLFVKIDYIYICTSFSLKITSTFYCKVTNKKSRTC